MSPTRCAGRKLRFERLESRTCLSALPVVEDTTEALTTADSSESAAAYGDLPLYFEANLGQAAARFDFLARGDGYALSLAPHKAAFDFPSLAESDPRLRLRFAGANHQVEARGDDPLRGVVNYYLGADPAQWMTNVPTFGRVAFQEVYRGIDLVYYGRGRQVEYDFVVAAGADAGDIRLAFKGARGVELGKDGGLRVAAMDGELLQRKPRLYQMVDGERVVVRGGYVLEGRGRVRFDIGRYEESLPLVIDPVFEYATYLGGPDDDRGLGIAVDGDGNAYVTGQSPNGANGDDAYVAKLSADGTELEYLTALGGSFLDAGFDIAVDDAGRAYVTGATQSANFPVAGGLDNSFNGIVDAFVAKLNASGQIVYSGYLGGKRIDFAEGIAIDSSGNAYVTGPTNSKQSTFPAVGGPDVTHNGGYDTFVAKVNAAGNGLVYCGYVGGGGDDVGLSKNFITNGHIAVDADGNAYVGGMTDSTQDTFPDGNGFGALPGFDQTHNGKFDAYVVKVNAAGGGLDYATYVGGAGLDQGFGMAVDAAGNAYLSGNTKSSEATFPVTVGPDLTYNGGRDAFVVKLDAAGTSLVYGGYIGGSSLDQGLGLTIDAAGALYVVGHTESSQSSFPVAVGPDLTFNGTPELGDAFVSKVSPDGTMLEFSGYVGGKKGDAAFWIALDDAGNAYIVGDTDSKQASFPDGDGFGALPGFDQEHNGGSEIFVVKISP